MSMQDDERQYHSPGGYVYTARFAFTFAEIWDGVESAEEAKITLGQIGLTLAHNKPATQVALARKDFATLRALIEAVP